MALDKFVGDEEESMSETGTSYGNAETWVVLAQIADPGVLREFGTCNAGEALPLVT